MLSRDYVPDIHQDLNDKYFNNAIVIMSVMKKLAGKKLDSEACAALFAIFQDNTILNKVPAINEYLRNVENADKLLYKTIQYERLVMIRQLSDPAKYIKHPAHEDYDIKITKLKSLNQETKKYVIDYLKKCIVNSGSYQSVNSKFLIAQLNNDTLNTQCKWNALLHYFKFKNNEGRNLYTIIASQLYDILLYLYKHHLKQNKLDKAATLIHIFPELSNELVRSAIVRGVFRREYGKYIKHETPLFSITFFNNDFKPTQVMSLYSNLSEISELIADSEKYALMSSIAKEYRSIKSMLTSSARSENLCIQLENTSIFENTSIRKGWVALIDYVVEQDEEGILVNNGKKLFRSIAKKVSEHIATMADQATLRI